MEEIIISEHEIFPGINIVYFDAPAGEGLRELKGLNDRRMPNILYCRSGQIISSISGKRVILNHGDFCLDAGNSAAANKIRVPRAACAGFILYININAIKKYPAEALFKQDIINVFDIIQSKYVDGEGVYFFSGSAGTDAVFDGFYDKPEKLNGLYRRLNAVGLLLRIAEYSGKAKTDEHSFANAELIELIRKIHSRLLENIDKRITIEELSRQYHINATTLKKLFKDVYGASLAAHMKEHRLERAAELLVKSGMSIAEISRAVGYDSQSKFSAAFKNFYGVLPKEYRGGK